MNERLWIGNQNRLSCHTGPVEVINNFYCGSMNEAIAMASKKIRVDTLIPLDSLDAAVWGLGFRGEILYYPIPDYGILPDDVLNELVSKILDRLGRGKKIGLFCMGGHGRTGYVASVVLGRLGYEDPINFLRSNYCQKAIESNDQIRHIAEVLQKPELVQAYAVSDYDWLLSCFDDFGISSGYSPVEPGISTCGDCARYMAGMCQKHRVSIDEDEIACEYFLENGSFELDM